MTAHCRLGPEWKATREREELVLTFALQNMRGDETGDFALHMALRSEAAGLAQMIATYVTDAYGEESLAWLGLICQQCMGLVQHQKAVAALTAARLAVDMGLAVSPTPAPAEEPEVAVLEYDIWNG